MFFLKSPIRVNIFSVQVLQWSSRIYYRIKSPSLANENPSQLGPDLCVFSLIIHYFINISVVIKLNIFSSFSIWTFPYFYVFVPLILFSFLKSLSLRYWLIKCWLSRDGSKISSFLQSALTAQLRSDHFLSTTYSPYPQSLLWSFSLLFLKLWVSWRAEYHLMFICHSIIWSERCLAPSWGLTKKQSLN